MQGTKINLENIIPSLPQHSFSRDKKPLEPVTLIILGSKKAITGTLIEAGWYLPDQINLFSSTKAALATIFNQGYKRGPIWPTYIRGRKNSLGFEHATQSDNFRRRHHLRLWKTKFIANKNNVWVGTLSYDRGVGFDKNNFRPTHHINPSLIHEEGFLARNLGLKDPKYVTLAEPEEGIMADGDKYLWDGKALVVDMSNEN